MTTAAEQYRALVNRLEAIQEAPAQPGLAPQASAPVSSAPSAEVKLQWDHSGFTPTARVVKGQFQGLPLVAVPTLQGLQGTTVSVKDLDTTQSTPTIVYRTAIATAKAVNVSKADYASLQANAKGGAGLVPGYSSTARTSVR